MRALHLLLAVGAVALLSTPVRTQQPRSAALRDAGPIAGKAPRVADAGVVAPAVIQGSALSATNTKLPNAPVQLRDAGKGGIVSEQHTDKSGQFTFHQVQPGMYVVELRGEFGAVLAASDLIAVGPGDTADTIVQLKERPPAAAALASHGTSSLLAVLASAGAVGVLATAPTTEVSTERPRVP
jgi:hypothetical protein